MMVLGLEACGGVGMWRLLEIFVVGSVSSILTCALLRVDLFLVFFSEASVSELNDLIT